LHQVGDETRLYYDVWSTNHQDLLELGFSLWFIATFLHSVCVSLAFVGHKLQWNFTATCDILTGSQH